MAKDTIGKRQAYGLGSPLQGMHPLPIVADRAPLGSDRNYPIGQVWINQPLDDAFILTSVAANVAHWDSITAATPGSAPISRFIVAADGTAGYTTIQAAINAAVLAGGNATVYVRPGTYTENLTLATTVNVVGSIYADTTITGVHIPPAAGTFTFQNVTLTSATHIFNSAVAGTASLTIEDCIINCTNGYTFNLVNWTGPFYQYITGDISARNGFVNNTAGAAVQANSCDIGGGALNAFVISGNVNFRDVTVRPPGTFQGAGVVGITNSILSGTMTTAGTAAVTISETKISTGATAAINHGSAGILSLANVSITSSNNPAIAGAGAGVLSLGTVDFTSGKNMAATLTVGFHSSVDRISPYTVGATGTYATVQAAVNAANAAGGNKTVYVQPGTYAENLTLYSTVDIVGAINTGTTITGVHTPPAAGRFTFQNLTLTSATHIFNSAAAGTASLYIADCFINCTNGYTFNLVNWTGSLLLDDCGDLSTNNGFVNNTGGATIFVTDATVGAGVGNAFVASGGIVTLENTEVSCPGTFGGAAVVTASMGCRFNRTVTTAGTAAITISETNFSTGATAAINHGSAGILSLANVSITSSNNPAIAGAGAGVVTMSGCEFTSGSNLAATLTISSVPETRSTKLACGDATYRVNAFSNENDVIQAYATDATAAGAADRNAIEGNLRVTSGNGNHTPDAVQGAIFAIAGSNALTMFGVRGFCDQADGSVIASTAAGVEGHLNLLETNAADLPAYIAFGVKGYLDSTDAAGVPAGMTAGVGSIVEYNTPFNAKAYGFVTSRLNNGAGIGTAGQAAYGVLQGTVAIPDWLYGVDLHNGGQKYTNGDIRFWNQSKVSSATEGVVFSGDVSARSTYVTNTNIVSFDVNPILQSIATTGAAPAGATGNYNIMYLQNAVTMQQFILGAGQTIIAPRLDNDGLLISLDLVNAEGAEYYFGHTTRSRHTFTIGTSPAFFVEARFKVADCGSSDPLWVGFRKIGAPNAVYTTYTDAATIGLRHSTADDKIIIGSNLNNAGWIHNDTMDAWLDGAAHTLRVNVSAAGVVTFLIDGADPTSFPAYTFDNGDVVIPFIYHLFLAAAGAPGAIHLQSLKCGYQAWI